MTAASPLLDISGLHVSYGAAEVVHDVSLKVWPAQIVTLIGPNGAGKTTLLAAIMGQLPSRGDILFCGKNQQSVQVESRVFAGMTLVPEKRELFATMTVEDNLILGAYAPFSRGDRDYRPKLNEIYELFPRLKERRGQAARTLSGGERAMLVLGRALMAKPALLLLDEPSLGLAPLIVRDIFSTISGLRQSGVSVLLVEQNARAALNISDHAYVLETGRIVLGGCSAELADDPRVTATYLGARQSGNSQSTH